MAKGKGKRQGGSQTATGGDGTPAESPRVTEEVVEEAENTSELASQLDSARGEIASLKAQLAARDAEIAALKSSKSAAAAPSPDIAKLQVRFLVHHAMLLFLSVPVGLAWSSVMAWWHHSTAILDSAWTCVFARST